MIDMATKKTKKNKVVKIWALLGERNHIVTFEKVYGKKPPEHYTIGTWGFFTGPNDHWVLGAFTYQLPTKKIK